MNRAALIAENQARLDELHADNERRAHLRDLGLVHEYESSELPPPVPYVNRLFQPSRFSAPIETKADDDDSEMTHDVIEIIADELGRALGEHRRQSGSEIGELRNEVEQLRREVN